VSFGVLVSIINMVFLPLMSLKSHFILMHLIRLQVLNTVPKLLL